MKSLTDIQINQAAKLEPISEVIKKYGLVAANIIPYGNTKAKLTGISGTRKSKLVLVTSINPTKAGEGKTTVSIGLAEALNEAGHKTVLALREPSLGPVFGLKGGATGGGYSQVAPIDEINLHFTGDMHAITSANNLIAAAIDNEIHWGNDLKIKNVTFKRAMDMNDRTLRGDFQITAASEVMAVFSLAKDIKDLEQRINNIVIGSNEENKPVFVKDLGITGSVLVLLKDAFKPNAVQTLGHNLALIHGGPFANIAHGANSVVATDAAMKIGDITVTEAGFGSDLGAEKFFNIKSRVADLNPNVVVIVATIKALKNQGSLEAGVTLLEKHIDIVKSFNVNYVVALNEFENDSIEDKDALKAWAKQNSVPLAFANVWAHGAKGGKELAQLVLDSMSDKKIKFTYEPKDPIKTKIEQLAKSIYGAKGVNYSPEAQESIKFLEDNGLDKQYICIAKTPASLTHDAKVLGVPTDWELKVKDVTLSNGAGFIVVHCGNVMTMPGLSKEPQAKKINLVDDKIIGLD